MNPPAAPRRPARPWRAGLLLQGPHRLGFFAGGAWLAGSALWWAVALAARQAGWNLPWAVPPPLAHGLVMALAFMPLFMLGFLFTAGPRWLGQPEVPAQRLLPPVLAMSAGWGLVLAGVHAQATLAAAGMALVAAGWGWALRDFHRMLRTSEVPDRAHARLVGLAGGVGLLAMGAAAVALAAGHEPLLRAAVLGSLWGFAAPVFATVAHRMIPFFTASVLPAVTAWRPFWLLGTMLTALGATALGEVAQALAWPLPPAAHGLLATVQAPAAALLLWLALRWGLVQSLRVRLLAMLHAGFVWLGLALALAALSHGRVAMAGESAGLGLAPLHALTMGYLGATLLAMATRVVAGHSGRPLVADHPAWAIYWTLQAAAVLRLVAALWPQAGAGLLLPAVVAWALACTAWALRYGRWLGRPRADAAAPVALVRRPPPAPQAGTPSRPPARRP